MEPTEPEGLRQLGHARDAKAKRGIRPILFLGSATRRDRVYLLLHTYQKPLS